MRWRWTMARNDEPSERLREYTRRYTAHVRKGER